MIDFDRIVVLAEVARIAIAAHTALGLTFRSAG
jgi:hypothetical protein